MQKMRFLYAIDVVVQDEFVRFDSQTGCELYRISVVCFILSLMIKITFK